MNHFLDMRGSLGRINYIIYSIFIAGITTGLIYLIYQALHSNHHLYSLSIFIGIVFGIFGFSLLMMQTIKRLNHIKRNGLWAPLVLIPVANIALFWFVPADTILNSWYIIIPILGAITLIPLYLIPKAN